MRKIYVAVFGLVLSSLINTAHAANEEMDNMPGMDTSGKSHMDGMKNDQPMMFRGHLQANVMRPTDCGTMELFDVAMAMCMPLPMPSMPMSMAMVHGNSFLADVAETGPRGRSGVVFPDMFMADIGTTVGDRQYLNLDFMGTIERWTFPDQGYPLLLQIGEDDASGQPYLDAQHPHSSPIMGLTLSDTISFGREKDHIKISISPRGEATDGPIAFMHRATGIVNPDAPLGHHIGQDVGHITSSVIAESLKIGSTRFEASTYHGSEPSPTRVDLPLGSLDSFSLRLIEEFSTQFLAMASYAYVANPEPDSPDITSENRYSVSIYNVNKLSSGWSYDNTLIYGAVTSYDHASVLNSFAEEFLFMGDKPRIWGRVEILQRTPAELQIATAGDANGGKWVSEITLGYTHKIGSWESAELGVGASVTADIVSPDFQATYGGNPWAGKIFLQFGGMKMWEL